jgi:hypothetical protein
LDRSIIAAAGFYCSDSSTIDCSTKNSVNYWTAAIAASYSTALFSAEEALALLPVTGFAHLRRD